jgi:hypothetical protein
VYRPGADDGGGDGGGGGGAGPGSGGEEEDDEEGDDLEMAPGSVVRFRVREVRFLKRPPPGEGGGTGGGGGAGTATTADPAPPAAPFAPLEVIADFTDVGLGPVAWWAECEDAAAEGGDG